MGKEVQRDARNDQGTDPKQGCMRIIHCLWRKDIRALTVSGVFQPMEDPSEQQRILKKLLERHPHLKEFAESGETKVLAVRAKAFQLLDGVSRSYFEEAD